LSACSTVNNPSSTTAPVAENPASAPTTTPVTAPVTTPETTPVTTPETTAPTPAPEPTPVVTPEPVAVSLDLSALSISEGTLSPSFSSGTTDYTVAVANSVASVAFTPTASAGSSVTITVDGNTVASGVASGGVSLTAGVAKAVSIIVSDGSNTKTYTITVTRAAASSSVNTTKPSSTVNLVFIHHSSGRNWLRTSSATGDFPGALAQALNNNNYYVTDTDYGWDAQAGDNLGDGTDTVNWPSWFVDAKMPYVYANTSVAYYGDSSYSNSIARASGDNEVVIFKSCYPNSEVGGSIADEQAIYNGLLTYFAAHTDKLFILIIPPAPVSTSSYVLTKQLNDWLVDTSSGWLSGYAHNNVGVYDYYCTLSETDSHHTVEAGSVVHSYSASYGGNSPYHTGGDSHPSTAGNTKATTEFLPLLNYYYNTWKGN